MKKIIKGKLYNTATAKECGEYSNGYYGDFAWVTETLYKKKTGEFFIAGCGGPMSKYALGCGNNIENIIPLTLDEAKEWAVAHLDADKYIKFFGTPEETP